MLLCPGDGRRIGTLAGEKEGAESGEIVFADERAIRIVAPDRAKAVGAVKKATAPCSAMTRQKAPASGVPTGFPS
jgi:hypothetical protein